MTQNNPIEYQIYAVKCKILKNNPSHFPKIVHMKNWDSEEDVIDDITIQRTPRFLVFYLGERKSIKPEDIEKETQARYTKVIELANKIQEKYGIVCNSTLQIPIRKEIKLKIPIDQIEDYSWYSNITKKVYPKEIEFIHPKFAEQHVKNFINNMSIESYAKQILEDMVKWNINFEKHYGVLDSTQAAINELRNQVKKLANVVSMNNLTEKEAVSKRITYETTEGYKVASANNPSNRSSSEIKELAGSNPVGSAEIMDSGRPMREIESGILIPEPPLPSRARNPLLFRFVKFLKSLFGNKK